MWLRTDDIGEQAIVSRVRGSERGRMTSRRAFLAAIAGAAPVTAVVAVAAAPGPDLSRWKITRYTGRIECDCETALCPSDFAAHWLVVDRSTNQYRMMCDRCVTEFRAAPVPLERT